MKIKVQLFGITREIVGKSQLEVEIAEQTKVEDLLKKLKIEFSALNNLSSLAVAVNSDYADNQLIINPNDEVALIPPVSGG